MSFQVGLCLDVEGYLLQEPSLGLVGAVLSFLHLIKYCANALMKTLKAINAACFTKDRNISMYSPPFYHEWLFEGFNIPLPLQKKFTTTHLQRIIGIQ